MMMPPDCSSFNTKLQTLSCTYEREFAVCRIDQTAVLAERDCAGIVGWLRFDGSEQIDRPASQRC